MFHIPLCHPVPRKIMGVDVPLSAGPQVRGNLLKVPPLYGRQRPVDGHVGAVALGGQRQVYHCLGENYPGLWKSNEVRGVSRGGSHRKGPGIGKAHVLGGEHEEAPGDKTDILPTCHEPSQPVDRRIGVGAPHALDQG